MLLPALSLLGMLGGVIPPAPDVEGNIGGAGARSRHAFRAPRETRRDQREEQRVRAQRAASLTGSLSDADLARLFPFYPAAKPIAELQATASTMPDVATQERAQELALDPGLLVAILAAFDEDF